MVQVVLAVAAAAAIIASAPVVQQGFTAASSIFPNIGRAATAVPAAAAVIAATLYIRERRRLRFSALALAVTVAAAYIWANSLSATESFHFIEYGLLASLFYFAVDPADDGAILILPLVAGIATGILDEWFQWFVPIRAGELRDVVLDAVASGCGVLFGISLRLPVRLTFRLHRVSRPRVAACIVATVGLFVFFIAVVHVGYEVRDPEIGAFVSRFRTEQLDVLSRDRAARWRIAPPVAIQRFSREDQYLSEGLWHVQQRNEAWEEGDVGDAWRENLILERFFAPVLDVPTYASATAQRWPPEQHTEAASRPGVDRRPAVHTEYRWPLYVFR